MPKITIHNPDGTSVKYGLTGGKSFTVGRAENNDIVLPGGSASNHHAVLKLTDSGDFSVTDFDSTNHTRVNGDAVQTKTLRNGDAVQFGDISAEYFSDVEAPAAEAPASKSQMAPPTPALNPLPAQKPAGPPGPGVLAPGRPAQAQSYSAGEGCFAMLLVILLAIMAFVGGVWIRHAKDRDGQQLNDYWAGWRLDQKKAENAAAAAPQKP